MPAVVEISSHISMFLPKPTELCCADALTKRMLYSRTPLPCCQVPLIDGLFVSSTQ